MGRRPPGRRPHQCPVRLLIQLNNLKLHRWNAIQQPEQASIDNTLILLIKETSPGPAWNGDRARGLEAPQNRFSSPDQVMSPARVPARFRHGFRIGSSAADAAGFACGVTSSGAIAGASSATRFQHGKVDGLPGSGSCGSAGCLLRRGRLRRYR